MNQLTNISATLQVQLTQATATSTWHFVAKYMPERDMPIKLGIHALYAK